MTVKKKQVVEERSHYFCFTAYELFFELGEALRGDVAQCGRIEETLSGRGCGICNVWAIEIWPECAGKSGETVG
jgi:hypothetical protein